MRKPWGKYWVLLSRPQFKVKLLYFKEGGEISLQRHFYRDETWCFLKGGGWMKNNQTTKGIKKYMVAGDSTIVPRGYWHHYRADKPTYILEVQTGLCKEEDIERVY